MLSASRKFAQSWVAKGLFVILILSFVLWGVGDVLMPRHETGWAAKVDEVVISHDSFSDEYQATTRRLGAAFGSRIDPNQARALGLDRTVLQQMIDRALIDVSAADLGLSASDEAIKALIESDPQFHNSRDQFDVGLFRQLLRENGLTEARYVEQVRASEVRRQLTDAIASGVILPPEIVDGLYQFRNETRVARYVHIADSIAETTVGTPDEPTLRAFHSDNPGPFTAPEYRSVSAMILTVDGLMERVQVSDAAVEDLYAERIDDLATPEQRTLIQFSLANEDAARAAMRRIADGEDFGVVGAEVSGLDVADLGLTGVSREQLPIDLADAVFSAPIDTPIGPVQSPIGWHVIKVTEIAPSNTPSLEEVRAELELELAQEQAFDEMIELSEDVQDVLGGGGTLGEAAAQLDLPLRTIPAMDLGGLDESGMPVTDLPPQFIETVAATPEGSESELVEADDETFFIIRVDAIRPATLKPFETVRADVEHAWRAEEKRTASQRTADAVAAQIDGGTPLAAIAETDELMVQTTAPLTRSSQVENLPREFVDHLFEAKAGKSFVLMDGTGVIVAEVGDVTVPNPAADAQNRDLLSDELVNAAQQDRLSELAVALRGRHSVEVNPEVFESPY